MRTLLRSSNIIYVGRHRGSDRRQVTPSSLGVTCLVLVRHHQTDKAILVSDCGVYAKAVWVPKAMLTIHEPSERGVLVATMSKAFAEQKDLHPRFIDPELFNQATREVLESAVARAAKKRNFYRGHRSPHARHDSQNLFA
ncbi:hypothetical protein MA20_32105 [Bradyrhizobium japonicum]|uniref:Uncharacterized protein n=1 Tax=Bradyrhizobium japonicum TaxID=375 RepID=A0A0A3YQ63_BRAJP|nr:hypothetical protein [Bradyrhizobium japonicum]KGT75833.1 hypothetical protein MA20_32105 [Bradyrhizobium japonicum]